MYLLLTFVGCMNQASFDEQRWDSLCTKAHECLTEQEDFIYFEVTLTALLGYAVNLEDDERECRQEYDDNYKNDFTPEEDCDFNVDNANDCIRKLKEAECDDVVNVLLSSDCTKVCD